MAAPHTLVLATRNRGKLVELGALFSGLGVDLVLALDVLGRDHEVDEDGATFEDNAIKKAKEIAALTCMMTLADDSGLEVDALSGAPGVRSARYAHARATDAENNATLLAALESLSQGNLSPVDATARFRCVLALVDPYSGGEPLLASGACEGSIVRAPRGAGGFGYDPLFLVAGESRTMAELSEDEKNRVSHRARAAHRMREILQRVVATR